MSVASALSDARPLANNLGGLARHIFLLIPCVTEHPGLGAFPISDIAKRFYISARIQTNIKDNFTNLSAL
jgi:hypothetical protein